MGIEKNISDLLHEHDCVIVPNFGGFVANYAGAKIHPTQHSFSPPYKKISFNRNLKSNDGLLANNIAMNHQVNYTKANEIIANEVIEWNNKLLAQKKITLDKIGTLFVDVEQNIGFEPDESYNHLLDSFGLNTFTVSPVRKDTPQQKFEKQFVDRSPIPQKKRKINVKKYVALAIALPLLLSAWWVSMNTETLKNINYSNLNPFSSKEDSLYKPQQAKIFSFDFSDEKQTFDVADTSAFAKLNLTSDGATIVVKMNDGLAAQPDKTNVVAPSTNATNRAYHIVAGCFQILDNANNLIEQLRSQNISATIIGQNKNGLYIVSCGNFNSKNQAIEELQKIKSSVNNQAWLLKM